MVDVVNDFINFVKIQTNIELKEDNYFPTLDLCGGEKIFYIDLSERVSESKKFIVLERLANEFNLFSVDPAGVNRVAIAVKGNPFK